jgi:hypothetical protein
VKVLDALSREFRRQTMGPVRLRRQVFSPTREYRRIVKRRDRVLADPSFELETWESHQPVLLELLERNPAARVLELGMGYASTPIVLALAGESVSLETDADWFARFARFDRPSHRLQLWTDYDEHEWRCPYLKQQWDVAFIDNSPYGTRQTNLLQLADNSRFIVCHDTEECFKPSGSDYRWDFSSFEHVWTYTRFENYTTVVSRTEPIPLEWLGGIAGQPTRSS